MTSTQNLARGLVFKLMMTQQFWWFILHVLLVLFFIIYNISAFMRPAEIALAYYRYTLVMVITTYVIVLARTKRRGVSGLLADENFQYFTVAVTFYMALLAIGAVSGVLYPYMVYLVFHILGYVQNHLLEYLGGSIEAQQGIHARIGSFVKSYNQQALFLAATTEVMLLIALVNPLVVLFTVVTATLQGHPEVALGYFACLLVVVVFVKFRYDALPFTKAVVAGYDEKAFQFVTRFPVLVGVYGQIKALIISLVAPIKVPRPTIAKKKKTSVEEKKNS